MKQELLTLSEHMSGGLCCLYVYCSVMGFFFFFVCLRVVSLDCSFIIVPSVLSNVYLSKCVFNVTF